MVIVRTAATPQYVHGITADDQADRRRTPAQHALFLPGALLLSQFVRARTPILMLGATYLSYEGAEKVWGRTSAATRRTAPLTASAGEHAEKQIKLQLAPAPTSSAGDGGSRSTRWH